MPDETTSGIGHDVTFTILVQCVALMGRATMIGNAHSLSTIARIDRPIMREQGKIVAIDGHVQLLALDGIYAEFRRYHSCGFVASKLKEI